MLTKRQKQILDFIISFQKKNEYAPTLDEISKKFKFASVSTAHFHITKLRDLGFLEKEKNKPRAIDIAKKDKIIKIPIVGTITAGKPIEAIEVSSPAITISKNEISTGKKYYALKVSGDSMIEEGIFDGDVVVIRKQEFADNGQTVVAIIDDNQATLKKLYREKNQIRLQPANHSMLPIFRREVEVRGVVVKIIRNLETQIKKEKRKDEKYIRRIDYSWDYRGGKNKIIYSRNTYLSGDVHTASRKKITRKL